MSYVKMFAFFAVLVLGQCQRLTTSEAPWVWGEDSSNNQNPFIRTTKPPRTMRTTQPTNTENSVNPKDAPSPRVCPGCPRTPQFNPVCGSDNATYDNANAVDCANTCGPKIEILFYAACRPTA
ncbi:uncharacterized protein LOC117171577 [Belonocnema kinseyi]|uniref:uncharacterized protein LOC117171577 n=1 Tax=Belonocnema kinseyi TaxID=2817044 RepID=UPI00143D3B4A|nr:uncharacterized protein LOC117171577 [Belonocnema kinseyi]